MPRRRRRERAAPSSRKRHRFPNFANESSSEEAWKRKGHSLTPSFRLPVSLPRRSFHSYVVHQLEDPPGRRAELAVAEGVRVWASANLTGGLCRTARSPRVQPVLAPPSSSICHRLLFPTKHFFFFTTCLSAVDKALPAAFIPVGCLGTGDGVAATTPRDLLLPLPATFQMGSFGALPRAAPCLLGLKRT